MKLYNNCIHITKNSLARVPISKTDQCLHFSHTNRSTIPGSRREWPKDAFSTVPSKMAKSSYMWRSLSTMISSMLFKVANLQRLLRYLMLFLAFWKSMSKIRTKVYGWGYSLFILFLRCVLNIRFINPSISSKYSLML